MMSFDSSLIDNMSAFLESVAAPGEKFTEETKSGICNALSVLMLDADARDKQDPFINNLIGFCVADQNKLNEMAELFNKYQPRYKEFVAAHHAQLQEQLVTEKITRDQLIKDKAQLQDKLLHLQRTSATYEQEKKEMEDKVLALNKSRDEVEKAIADKRKSHFAKIDAEFSQIVKSELNSEEKFHAYETAKALYDFTQIVMAVQFDSAEGDFQVLDEKGKVIDLDNYMEILKLIGASSAKSLEKQFTMSFNFTESELTEFLKTAVFDKDKIMLGLEYGHALYLSKTNNTFKLFNSWDKELFQTDSISELIAKLKKVENTVAYQFGLSQRSQYLPYTFNIYRNKDDPIISARPTTQDLIVKFLEQRKQTLGETQIDQPSASGHTLIPFAMNFAPAMVPELIKAKASLDFFDDKGETLLFKAINQHDDAMVKELLNAKVDIELKVSVGTRHPIEYTPLIQAAKLGHLSTVKILIENKADVNALDDRGLDVLYHAKPDEALFRYLLTEGHANPNRTELKEHPLHLQVTLYNRHSKENLNIILLLLEHKADPYLEQSLGSAFRKAEQQGCIDLCAKMDFKDQITESQTTWLKSQIDRLREFRDQPSSRAIFMRDDFAYQKLQIALQNIKGTDPESGFYLMKEALIEAIREMNNTWKTYPATYDTTFLNATYALLKEIEKLSRRPFPLSSREELEKIAKPIKDFPAQIPMAASKSTLSTTARVMGLPEGTGIGKDITSTGSKEKTNLLEDLASDKIPLDAMYEYRANVMNMIKGFFAGEELNAIFKNADGLMKDQVLNLVFRAIFNREDTENLAALFNAQSDATVFKNKGADGFKDALLLKLDQAKKGFDSTEAAAYREEGGFAQKVIGALEKQLRDLPVITASSQVNETYLPTAPKKV